MTLQVTLTEVPDDKGVVLDLSWDSFAFLPNVRFLLDFWRQALGPELYRVAQSYASLATHTDLGVAAVALRTVFGQEGAGLSLADNTLTVTLHCFSKLDGCWDVDQIDADTFFHEAGLQQTVLRCRGQGSLHISASLDRATRSLTRTLGFSVALPVASHTTLEELCR